MKIQPFTNLKNPSTRAIAVAIITMLLLVALPVTAALAASAGPNNAGTGATSGGTGGSWSNPGNITTVGTPYTTADVSFLSSTSEFLNGTNYGFTIPDGSTINGITVVVNRQSSGSSLTDGGVQLIKGGTRGGTDKASGTAWPTSFGTATYGGAADLWGTTWTAADINASNFGVALSAHSTSTRTATVDYMQISVAYTLPTTTTTVNCGAGTAVVTYGSGITCVATVTRGAGANTPGGTVSWTTGGAGGFVTSPCTLSGSGASASCSVTYTPSAVGTGSHLITATYSGSSNFQGSSGNQTVTVNKATPTLSVTNSPVTYDGAAHAATVAGSVPGSVTSILTGGTATKTAAGTYAVTANFTPTDTANYNSLTGAAAGNFIITPASSTTVVTCPISAVYTGLALTPCTVAVTGVGGLNLTPAAVYASNTNVGTASASYTFTGDANHTGSTDSKNFDITPAGSTTVVTCPVSAVYTGLALTPCTVAVTGAGGLNLTPAAVYASNTDVGTASASYTFTGDANHTGSTDSKNFDITPAGSTTVVTCPVSAVYTGLALTPCTVAVTGAGGLNLTPDAVYASNTDVGTASASYTFTGDANHSGSTDSKNFDITKAGSTTVVTCPVSAVYTGLALTPCTVAVTGAGGLNLTPDAVYASNTDVGTASASYTFTGDANHSGSTDSKNFDITKAGSTTIVTCPVSAVYTGLALTPCTVAVTGAGGLNLTPDAVYASNTDVGTASASYTFTGDANHTGSTDSKNFDITKAGSTTVVTCPISAVYTGLALTPCTVAVTGVGGLNLTPDAVYASNTDVGTASASYTFTGDANHTGSTDSKNFDITPAGSTTVVTCPVSAVYTGLALTPCTVAVTGAGGLNLTPDAVYASNTDVGTASASYTFTGDANHTGSTDSKNFDITPAGSTTVVTCPVSAVYTGLALTPCTVAVTGAGGLNLTPDAVYASNTDVGTASASYTFTGDANHSGSTDSKNFDITPAGSTTVVTCPVSAVYTGLALTPCTVAVTGAGGLNLTPDAVYASNTDVGTASASYTFTGDANHSGSTDSKNFDITKATPTVSVTNSPVTYNGAPQAAVVQGSVAGTSSNVKYDGSATIPTNAGTYVITADFAPTDATNYSSLTGAAAGNFTIGKANATILVTPYNVVHDGNPHTATATATGVLGESLSGLDLTGTTHTVIGDYLTDPWTFTDVTGNYNNASGMVHDVISAPGAPIFTPTPASGNFGVYRVNMTSAAKIFTIKNTGTASLVVGAVTLGGTNPGQFHITANTCPVVTPVPANGTCTVTVNFKPTALLPTPNKAAFLNFPDNAAGHPHTIALSGKAGVEQAVNGGFNLYPSPAAKTPTNWVAANFAATDGKNTLMKHEGTASVKIANTFLRTKTLMQTRNISGVAGQTFVLSLWAKGQSIPTSAGLVQAQVLFYNGSTLVQNKVMVLPNGTYGFTRHLVAFTSTGTYNKVVIKLAYSKASGSVWFDALDLLRVP